MTTQNIAPVHGGQTLVRSLAPHNQAKAASVLTATVAVGGKQVLKSAAGRATVQVIEAAAPGLGKAIASGGTKAAGRALPALALAELGVRQYMSKQALENGEIDEGEYRCQTGGNVGSVGGSLAGAAGGAAIGSAILPGVGTVIGGILGGILGGMGGERAGRKVVESWDS